MTPTPPESVPVYFVEMVDPGSWGDPTLLEPGYRSKEEAEAEVARLIVAETDSFWYRVKTLRVRR